MVGFLIGAVLGIGISLAMVEFPLLRGSIFPLVIASQTIPKIAIAPLLIIWFGVGLAPKIITVSLLAFFPVLINTVAGFESADRGHIDLLRSVDAKNAKFTGISISRPRCRTFSPGSSSRLLSA